MFPCSFYSQLVCSERIYSPRKAFILGCLLVCSPLCSRAVNGNREGLVDISHCPSIPRGLHCDELTEDCKKHRNVQLWSPFLIHVISRLVMDFFFSVIHLISFWQNRLKHFYFPAVKQPAQKFKAIPLFWSLTKIL